MKRAEWLLITLVAVFWPRLGVPQENVAPRLGSHRVVTATRLVAVFSELETEWLQGVQRKDATVLDRLLGEDFQELSASAGRPVPREEWQSRAFAQEVQSFRIRQMGVRPLNEEMAVASFVLNESVRSGGALQEQSWFVVDVWTRANGRWVCVGRYASPVSAVGEAATASPSGKR